MPDFVLDNSHFNTHHHGDDEPNYQCIGFPFSSSIFKYEYTTGYRAGLQSKPVFWDDFLQPRIVSFALLGIAKMGDQRPRPFSRELTYRDVFRFNAFEKSEGWVYIMMMCYQDGWRNGKKQGQTGNGHTEHRLDAQECHS